MLRHRKGLLKEVQQLQNKYVRIVAGVYRATNVKVLENETRIMPIDIYMEGQIINAHRRNRPKVDSVVTNTCRRICNRLKGKRGKSGLAKITVHQAKLEWSKKILANHQLNPQSNGQQYRDPNSIAIQQYQEKARKKWWEKF